MYRNIPQKATSMMFTDRLEKYLCGGYLDWLESKTPNIIINTWRTYFLLTSAWIDQIYSTVWLCALKVIYNCFLLVFMYQSSPRLLWWIGVNESFTFFYFIFRAKAEINYYLKLTHNFGRIHDLKWCLEGGFLLNEVSVRVTYFTLYLSRIYCR